MSKYLNYLLLAASGAASVYVLAASIPVVVVGIVGVAIGEYLSRKQTPTQ